MDNNKRQLLERHQQDIIKDLDVDYIYDELFQKHVISAEDFDHIFQIVSINWQSICLPDTKRSLTL